MSRHPETIAFQPTRNPSTSKKLLRKIMSTRKYMLNGVPKANSCSFQQKGFAMFDYLLKNVRTSNTKNKKVRERIFFSALALSCRYDCEKGESNRKGRAEFGFAYLDIRRHNGT